MKHEAKYLPSSKDKINGALLNPLTPELNPSAQSYLPRCLAGDFKF
jgi:hypothetical protein